MDNGAFIFLPTAVLIAVVLFVFAFVVNLTVGAMVSAAAARKARPAAGDPVSA
ncbi:MAG: hypothetical protein J7484_10425 [Microbacterium sp.]|nr:hypothetical protein [Microbacterium sp.]